LLIVNDIRLTDFLAEASRYRRDYLNYDGATGNLRLSRIFA
jgi:ferric-dicitrate binding protein FerR (iron transport regulator)